MPLLRTPMLIRKVDRAVNTPNPPSQRQLAVKLGISQRTVNRVLTENFGMNYRKKVRTHVLTATMAAQRLDRGPVFLRCLSRRKLPYIITIDETYVTMNDITGQRNGIYENKESPRLDEWKKKSRSGWPGKVMVAMGICMRGKSSLFAVPPKAKIDYKVFIDRVLKPLFRRDVPRLYPGEEKKVILHVDSAPAHIHHETIKWLQDREINFITKEEWMANSPDLAPMDYAVNGIFKGICNGHQAKDSNQLVRIAKRAWKDFVLEKIQSSLLAWPD